MGFQFVKDTKAAENAAGGGIKTGVHKLTVVAVALEEDSKQNPRVNIYLEDATGNRAVVFGMCIAQKWTTGSDNMEYAKWQEFAAICGMETGALAQANIKTNKAGDIKPMNVFTECTGKVINVALQEKFDVITQGKKAGEVSNDKSIYRTFNIDGKSLAEIATNTPAKSIEAIKSTLTPYETKAFKAKKANGGATAEPGTEPDSEEASEAPADLI